MEVDVLAFILGFVRVVAIPALAYMLVVHVRTEKCLSSIKRDLEAREKHCKSRGKLLAELITTANRNDTNIAIIAALLDLSDKLEQ